MNSIYIEGMCLSGKSTVADEIVRQKGLEWRVRHGYLNEENPIRELADQLVETSKYSTNITDDLYIVGLKADSLDNKETGFNIVQDSIIAVRALAHHIVHKNNTQATAIKSLLEQYPKFDGSFYLTSTIGKRQERFKDRVNKKQKMVSSHDLLVVNNPKIVQEMDEIVGEYAVKIFSAHKIDTSNMSIQEIIEEINRIYNPNQIE